MLGVQGDAHINSSSGVILHERSALPVPGSVTSGAAQPSRSIEHQHAIRRSEDDLASTDEGGAGAAWTEEEKGAAFAAAYKHGEYALDKIAADVKTKTAEECRRFLGRERLQLEGELQRQQAQIQAELTNHSPWG
mmetsp:Transcript_17280/g.35365  ORF Transcript_17280/g.35365 Transcript_17280/m.35365 type:complete len:135 (+) Transcript_17280:60-464(+)